MQQQTPHTSLPVHLWKCLTPLQRHEILCCTIKQFPMSEEQATRIILSAPEDFDILSPRTEEECEIQCAVWNLLKIAQQQAAASPITWIGHVPVQKGRLHLI